MRRTAGGDEWPRLWEAFILQPTSGDDVYGEDCYDDRDVNDDDDDDNDDNGDFPPVCVCNLNALSGIRQMTEQSGVKFVN